MEQRGINIGSERLFIAIRLPEQLRAALGQRCRRLASELEFSKWVHAEDYHITLQFLGDTAPEKIPPLIDALKVATVGVTPFQLSVQQWGTFGPSSSPRVLWCGITGDLLPLHNLQQAVTSATLPLGFTGEERKYSPHITLARKYKGERPYSSEGLHALQSTGIAEDGDIEDVPWTVDSMVIFVTRMNKSPMYEVVEKISFF
ncbi:RNA 2',3'-cyclic phosphodiesterase [Paenibacillus wynnii]|uniref:RNA 2',3'-cyclic phosphodiesterase n=1 Tax=Paenibacillus wynnii TaxID=268407 RepID=UPI00278FB9A7|nr:RNA 2',3'-cyclic phosphodiesterase [Paenibacillus wynnii]MDQ0193994.1 2'-5' RNA ligase [Paenibacillus wynnii]